MATHSSIHTPVFQYIGIPPHSSILPTPVFWPAEFHELHSPWAHTESNATEWFSLSLRLEGHPSIRVDYHCWRWSCGRCSLLGIPVSLGMWLSSHMLEKFWPPPPWLREQLSSLCELSSDPEFLLSFTWQPEAWPRALWRLSWNISSIPGNCWNVLTFTVFSEGWGNKLD